MEAEKEGLEDRRDGVVPVGKKSMFIKIAVGAIVVLVLGAIGVRFVGSKNGSIEKGAGTAADDSNPPQFIQADFIDLSKIFAVSKYRSGSGHDFSKGSGESCRSMKHYFNPQESAEKEVAWNANNGIPPMPDGKNDIAIYSPVDGKITKVAEEQTPIGVQVYIRPDSYPDATVRLFHIYLDDGVGKNSIVKAGQKIGNISRYASTDIAINTGSFMKPSFFSYFALMPDGVFANYQARGVKSRDDLILTKEYRDAHPLECKGEQFAQNYDSGASFGNHVYLSGYSGTESYNSSTAAQTNQSSTTNASTTSTSSSNGDQSSNEGAGGGAGQGSGNGGGNGSGDGNKGQ